LGSEQPRSRAVLDPCQLVWQVKEFGKLEGAPRASVFDPCQLAWQVKQFGKLEKEAVNPSLPSSTPAGLSSR
jgi:hypothetical protein